MLDLVAGSNILAQRRAEGARLASRCAPAIFALCSAAHFQRSRTMPSPAPQVPKDGQPISFSAGRISVPDRPVIPFIEGDGTGPDLWRASQRVLDAAVEKAYGGKPKIAWVEVFAGENSKNLFDTWLPDQTLEALRKYPVRINSPLT